MKLQQALKSNNFNSELQKAGLNILYTAWWLKTSMSKVLKDFAITHEQYNILRILKGKYPEQLCVKDIAGRMIEKNSNVPRIIDRLEIKKLAKRNSSLNDKRETVITITNAGINILNITAGRINQSIEELISINNKEAATLNLLLEKMRSKEV